MGYARKDLEKTKKIAKKFVRYQEGAELYSIGLTKFQELAKEAGGDERSEYGLEVIKKISKELTQRYGKGYDRSNLYHCLKFYKTFPEIVDTACRQSGVLLSWSHYRTLLQVFYNYILKCFVLIDLKTEKIRRMQNIMEYLE